MDLESKVQSAIGVGEALAASCLGLHTEMRDMDILSARVSCTAPPLVALLLNSDMYRVPTCNIYALL